MHVRLEQGHRVKAQRGQNLYIVGSDRLGDMLLVLLAFFGNINHQVTENTGITTQAPATLEALSGLMMKFGFGEFGKMIGTGNNAMFRKFTLLRQHLALATFPLPAADRFQVNAQSLGRLQHGRPDRNLSA
jgi:hypothetical protein